MKLLSRRSHTADEPGVQGVVRLDRRTSALTRRLRPGDIAVIDHVDLDRASAEALVARRVSVVVNAAESISGRYPNLGPEVLATAGIPLVDAVGPSVFSTLDEGQQVRVHGGVVSRGDSRVASGEVLDAERVSEMMTDARSGLAAQTEAFTASTMEYLKRERDLLLDDVGIPEISTRLVGRQALVVVRGYDYADDLRALRQYVKENRPVLIGVDGGADALVEAGYAPDLIVGDVDHMSDSVLRCGAEVVVHTQRVGRAPGLERLERLGVRGVAFAASGTSEDVAMLLANAHGATLIVAVGTHTTLVDFLDTGRSGLASTFLTRLRLGATLVDARAVGQLYRSRVATWQLLLLLVTGLLALGAGLAATPQGQEWLTPLLSSLHDAYDALQDLIS